MQQEKTMKTSTRIALAFLALAGWRGTAAYAARRPARPSRPAGGEMRFDRLDADQSGDITFEEFSAAMKSRIGEADKDGDGKMTVGEIASEIERLRAERMAKRIVERFDTDGDGMLTAAEIEFAPEEDVRAARPQRRRQGREGRDAARQIPPRQSARLVGRRGDGRSPPVGEMSGRTEGGAKRRFPCSCRLPYTEVL